MIRVTVDHGTNIVQFGKEEEPELNLFCQDDENEICSDKTNCTCAKSPVKCYGVIGRKSELNTDNFLVMPPVLKCELCMENFQSSENLENHKKQQIKCCDCNDVFCVRNIFDRHIQICQKQFVNNDTDGVVNCTKCSTVFMSKSQLEFHVCSINKLSFKCEKCSRIFSDSDKLQMHVMENECENQRGFTCDSCKKIFDDFDVLKKHISSHLENPLTCLRCNQKFISENLLSDHICERENYCIECDKVFEKESEFTSHLTLHQSVNICSNCNKYFTSLNELDVHLKECLTFFGCDDCGLKFKDDIQYKRHLRFHEYESKCKHCKQTFGKYYEYRKHLPVCSSKGSQSLNQKKYECDMCGKKYKRLVELKLHILNVHQGVNYECNVCNKKFLSQSECSEHIQKKDCKAEEPCRCEVCGKSFEKKDYLKKHQYIHSNLLYKCKFCYCAFIKEKSYKKHLERMNCSKSARKIKLSEFNYNKCRLCLQEFEEEDFLIKHFTSCHPGVNPHQCFCCDLCLPTFKDLQSHIHLHNIQKFTCNLCGKPYTSQEGFRKHRLKHKGAEFKCQFCESEFLNESRFKFHVKTCKKNPESGYRSGNDNIKPNKKCEKPKQSRQLHWESRIIMKRLRGDPNSMTVQSVGSQNNVLTSFFDEPDDESSDSNVRGWFDDYYKTEEDDFAFGLKKENSTNQQEINSNEVAKNGTDSNQGTQVVKGDEDDVRQCPSESSAEDYSSDSSKEEEDITEDLNLNYNPKKCRICMITFGQEYELLHHFIKVHPKKKAHKCPNCDAESPLFAQLKEHMKIHGIGIGIFYCDNCSKKFKSEKKMKSHNIRCKGLNTDSGMRDGGEGEDYCKKCCKKFQTKCGYRRHKQVCKGRKKGSREKNKSRKKVNEDVGPQIPSDNEVEEVQKVEEQKPGTAPKSDLQSKFIGEPPMDSFPCRLCDKKFQYERGIVMHFKSDHPGQKPLICHICNMQLADKLKEHLKTHGIGEEFICELCGKRFNQKFLSKIHEMWHQGIEYKCGNCKQKFLNKEKMEKHVGENRCSNRQSLMRLPCDICGKSYRSKFGLSKHYITHTPKELRPVKNRMNCEYCGKWFENNNGLQRHRRIHTGERPFCCRFCSKAFAQEGNCKAHERIHTGESRPRKKKKTATPSYPLSVVNTYIYNGVSTNLIEPMQ